MLFVHVVEYKDIVKGVCKRICGIIVRYMNEPNITNVQQCAYNENTIFNCCYPWTSSSPVIGSTCKGGGLSEGGCAMMPAFFVICGIAAVLDSSPQPQSYRPLSCTESSET